MRERGRGRDQEREKERKRERGRLREREGERETKRERERKKESICASEWISTALSMLSVDFLLCVCVRARAFFICSSQVNETSSPLDVEWACHKAVAH